MVNYSSSSQTYLLSNGGTLQISSTGGGNANPNGVAGSSSTSSVGVTANFLYTAAGSAAAAPEPGTIALLLTAGVPVVGIVRRRAKKSA